MLFDLMKEKNIGVNSLRSSYISYWIPKINANQVQRISYLMRTSNNILYSSYLKKDEEEIKSIITTPTPTQEIKKEIPKLTPEQKQKYKTNRLEYNKKYYDIKKDVLLERAKENSKNNNWRRTVRDLRTGRKDAETSSKATIEKYKIKFDNIKNMYVSGLHPE